LPVLKICFFINIFKKMYMPHFLLLPLITSAIEVEALSRHAFLSSDVSADLLADNSSAYLVDQPMFGFFSLVVCDISHMRK